MSYDAWKGASPEGDEDAPAWGDDEPSEAFAHPRDFAAEATFAALCAASEAEDARIRAAGGDPAHECESAICHECAA